MNTFDEIIQTKAYNDLTPNELEVIRELVSSEEEYNEMKSFYAGIDQLAISNSVLQHYLSYPQELQLYGFPCLKIN